MKINPDGSIEITDPAEVAMYLEHIKPRPVEVPLAQALAGTALAAQIDVEAASMRDPDVEPEPTNGIVEREVVVMPVDKVLPAKIAMPPVAYVTQAQILVLELLRHHGEGLSTKKIAELLRWDHPKATRITTGLERGHEGVPKLVARIPGRYVYKLSDIGYKSAFKVVSQPARMR